MRIRELGILLVGPSGIGKSECALDLVSRGHALVADDAVRIARDSEDRQRLVGWAPELTRYTIEIRGIGLLTVPELYGPASVCDRSSVDLVCRLAEWREGADFDRIGIDRARESWLGVELPRLTLPARPAGSMATLVEAGAFDHARRLRGTPSAAERIDAKLRSPDRIVPS